MQVKSPLPGIVNRILAEVGSQVSEGDPALTVEVMKALHTIKFSSGGIVKEIHVKVGDEIAMGQVVMELQT